jgi:hypothetical protein
MINTDFLYEQLMLSSNRAIMAFNALTLELIDNKIFDSKRIINKKDKLTGLLWEWQSESEVYLNSKPPKNKEESENLFSYKIYKEVESIYNLCYIHKNPGIHNTICAILYDTCLYSTWFIAGIENYYFGKLPKVFASDIFDVNDGYVKNILKLADKCSSSYAKSIELVIQYLKDKHPLIEKSPLGKMILRSEFQNIFQQ